MLIIILSLSHSQIKCR